VIGTIVVPLDGSPLSERALAPAHYLASRLHAAMEVVHVFEPEVTAPYVSGAPPFDMRLDAELRREAKAYVDRIAESERSAGDVPVRATLLHGPVVETLAAHLAEHHHALAVMMTHGRSGIERVLLGSVTDALVRSATAPVLAIRATKETDAPVASRFGRVLVPIAGADFGADMVERVADVLGATNAEYVLFHAVVPAAVIALPDPAFFPPALDVNAEQEAARTFLDSLAAPLRARGAEVRTRVVVDVDPAHAILGAVNETRADAISMATHGYRGVERLVLGSVAAKVLRHSPVPVLLVRPPESAESMDNAKAGHAA
jgi:nucleotide-binding universal stress UspA family protein